MSDSATLVAIFSQVSRLLKNLTDDEVQSIVTGETQIRLVPKGSKLLYPLDLPSIAAEIRKLGSQDEIMQILDSDTRLNAANLRKVAGALNIDLPSSARSKGAMQLHIAQSASSHWQRTRGGL
jgi:hypothetical protein